MYGNLRSWAVVVDQPGSLGLDDVALRAPAAADVAIDVEYSGISTGTERLLYNGEMPWFPGLGYPLVPGYESIGRVREAGADSGAKTGYKPGDPVFVPGANCFGEIRGLFGGAARHLIVPSARLLPIDPSLGERGVLLALAATARHALYPESEDGSGSPPRLPDLIVGHGVLGRLLARLCIALGGAAPTVWERDARRREADAGYPVCAPEDDDRRDYARIVDVSGDPSGLDDLIGVLARGGEIVLAGFYRRALSFNFPPAFMREARMRVAAEWQRRDLCAVHELAASGRLSLDGLITHRHDARQADAAYGQAFGDASCLKSVLDWRALQ